jgi:hypothetical protein
MPTLKFPSSGQSLKPVSKKKGKAETFIVMFPKQKENQIA